MIYKDISKDIERVRKELHNSIKKNGLNSEHTIQLSKKLDEIINEYFKMKNKNKDEDEDID